MEAERVLSAENPRLCGRFGRLDHQSLSDSTRLNRDLALRLTQEDGLVENLSAVFFVAAATFYGLARRRTSRSTAMSGVALRRASLLLLALGCLFVGMEEISWGQRIFHFETPLALKRVNTHGEFNIHNLRVLSKEEGLVHWYNIQRLFSLCWLVYCVVVPVLFRLHARIRGILEQLDVPIVPITLGLVFLGNYAVCKIIALYLWPDMKLVSAITEVKETNHGFLFLMTAFIEFTRAHGHPWHRLSSEQPGHV